MSKYITNLVCFFSLVLVLTNCREKEWEDTYGRPDGLAEPIYQQLQSRGTFTHFLACIDKASYKNTLSNAGYWTIFVPNDAAFEKFFSDPKSGFSSIGAIDSATARKIVTYSLVYNAFKTDHLGDYQSPTGWVLNGAFKRRTAYYTGVYTDTQNGQPIKAVASNRNGGYAFEDNNNKHIPYFLANYFQAKGLSASDYTYFYPQSSYTGFNVVDASVVTPNIVAENGIIHEIDRVITPLPSMDEYLAADATSKTSPAKYSDFRNLFEKYMVGYVTHPLVTNRYKVLTGSSDPVNVKFYSSALAFSPNNENYLIPTANDGQSNGWTMFAPTNEVLNKYLKEVLLEHYKSLDNLPPSIISDFLNAHMWQNTVWPSKFKTSSSYLGEEARFDPSSNILEAKVLSNGIFYGTNKVQEANVFASVFGKAYLDPRYSLMTKALEGDLRFSISNPSIKYTLFMLSDEALKKAGFSFNTLQNAWLYNGSQTQARERLMRVLNLHIVVTFQNELNNLSGEGMAETYGGEYIKYENNAVYAAGNADSSKVVAVDSVRTANNGIVYYTDGVLKYTELAIGKHLEGKPQFSKFFEYLNNSSMYTKNTGTILGISSGSFYTMLIPTNDAMQEAANAGLLPKSTNPASLGGKDSVMRFIQYHIIAKKTIVPNGKEEGNLETLYKTIEGDVFILKVINKPGDVQITDITGRTAKIINATTSVLSNRTVIHQLDNYLQYGVK